MDAVNDFAGWCSPASAVLASNDKALRYRWPGPPRASRDLREEAIGCFQEVSDPKVKRLAH